MTDFALDERSHRLFEEWVDETRARFVPPLTTTEVRKGVQALSWNYVEERVRGRDAARALQGEGKRAAFASYFAPLHFLATRIALAGIGPEPFAKVRVVHDIACGTGATGAALASALPEQPRIEAFDVSPWAVSEAKRTYDALLVSARTKRGALPQDFPRAGAADLLALGWAANELDEAARGALLTKITAALHRGAALFIAEPVSARITPWWDSWCARLAGPGAKHAIVRAQVDLPAWITALDDASGLCHDEIVAKVIWHA